MLVYTLLDVYFIGLLFAYKGAQAIDDNENPYQP